MQNIAQLLLNQFTTICLLVGFGIIVITNKNLAQKTNRSFILLTFIILALFLMDVADSYLAGLPAPTLIRHLASAIGYTLSPAALATLMGILLRRKKVGFLLWLPVFAIGLIAVTSYFTHLMFWFGELNQFMRGPLCYISHIVSGIYLLVLVILTIKMHSFITPGEVFAVIYSAIICVLAAGVESLLSGYKFVLTGAIITSCILYYVVLYAETYRRDALTGLMNRRSFYLDAKRMQNKSLAIVSVDLNSLKEINDTFGHSAGDKALQALGNAMLAKGKNRFSCYRVGGDEFMALGKEQSPEAANVYMEQLRATLREKDLMASFGFAAYHPGDHFDSVCNLADARMYGDKKQYRHRTGPRDEQDTAALSTR